MVRKHDNICLVIGERDVVVVMYGHELNELKDSAVDAGGPFWYIMGTDAWFEKEEHDGAPVFTARNHEQVFCSMPLPAVAQASLTAETGILVLFPAAELDLAYMQQLAGPDELTEWLTQVVGEDQIDGLIFCFYTEQDKKKYQNA